MKASEAIDYYKTLGITIRASGNQLRVTGTLTPRQKAVIAGHRKALLSALRGKDVELEPVALTQSMRALGLTRIETGRSYSRTGVETVSYGWTHAAGDAVAQQILSGVLDGEEAMKDANERSSKMEFRIKHPPTGRIHGRPNRF